MSNLSTGGRSDHFLRTLVCLRTLVGGVVCCVLIAGCGGSGGTTEPPPGNGGGPGNPLPPQTIEVRATDGLRFVSGSETSPGVVEIDAGGTVRWVSDSGFTHTVTPTGHSEFAKVETSGKGLMLEHVFTTPGTYAFYCEYHEDTGMTGSVIVSPN